MQKCSTQCQFKPCEASTLHGSRVRPPPSRQALACRSLPRATFELFVQGGARPSALLCLEPLKLRLCQVELSHQLFSASSRSSSVCIRSSSAISSSLPRAAQASSVSGRTRPSALLCLEPLKLRLYQVKLGHQLFSASSRSSSVCIRSSSAISCANSRCLASASASSSSRSSDSSVTRASDRALAARAARNSSAFDAARNSWSRAAASAASARCSAAATRASRGASVDAIRGCSVDASTPATTCADPAERQSLPSSVDLRSASRTPGCANAETAEGADVPGFA
eukprot:365832-Chlamydomonas_euryale.AAC.13